MKNKTVIVRRRIATGDGTAFVCGNSIYTITFDLDDEWSADGYRTARFKLDNGEYIDVPFSGLVCEAPIFKDIKSVTIGLYEGDLHTTTGAAFPCIPSILCGTGTHAEPENDVYNAIMDMMNKLQGADPELIKRTFYSAVNSGELVQKWATVPNKYICRDVVLKDCGDYRFEATFTPVQMPKYGDVITFSIDGFNPDPEHRYTKWYSEKSCGNADIWFNINDDGTITVGGMIDGWHVDMYYDDTPEYYTIPAEVLPESVPTGGTWEEWEFTLEDDTTVIKRVYVAGVE